MKTPFGRYLQISVFMKTSISEVTQIREQIAAEQMAGRLGLHGLNAGMARHAFITAKQERVAVLHGKLQELVGDVATAMVVETCDSLPDTLARADVLAVLRHEEETFAKKSKV